MPKAGLDLKSTLATKPDTFLVPLVAVMSIFSLVVNEMRTCGMSKVKEKTIIWLIP